MGGYNLIRLIHRYRNLRNPELHLQHRCSILKLPKKKGLQNEYAWRDDTIQTDIPSGVEVVKSDDLGEYEWYSVMDGSSQDPTATPLDDDTSASSVGQMVEQERGINPEILKKVIQDEEGNVYRIIPMEYKFLKKYGLPLPRRHWLSRLKSHFIT